MKLKLANLEGFQEAISHVLLMSLPVKKSYEVIDLLQKLEPHEKKIIKMRDTLINKYGDNDRINPQDPNFQQFIKELNEFMNLEIEIEWNKKIEIHCDLNEQKIKPIHLLALNKFIQFKNTLKKEKGE